jgi:hypothetical protein
MPLDPFGPVSLHAAFASAAFKSQFSSGIGHTTGRSMKTFSRTAGVALLAILALQGCSTNPSVPGGASIEEFSRALDGKRYEFDLTGQILVPSHVGGSRDRAADTQGPDGRSRACPRALCAGRRRAQLRRAAGSQSGATAPAHPVPARRGAAVGSGHPVRQCDHEVKSSMKPCGRRSLTWG